MSPAQNTLTSERRDFTLTTIGNGRSVHYVDDYRYTPGRTICGHHLTTPPNSPNTELPLCRRCATYDDYPTEAEFRAYWSCTDCGTDTWELGEAHYQVIPSVWEQAYPGYNSAGIGVGYSRPCIGCLEARLGRTLSAADFTLGPDSYTVDGQRVHTLYGVEGPRLANRLTNH